MDAEAGEAKTQSPFVLWDGRRSEWDRDGEGAGEGTAVPSFFLVFYFLSF